MVRSNPEAQCGFVNVANRICVSLSRARNGLYVIGNLNMLASKSSLWKTICDDMQQRGQMSDSLCLQCANHPDTAPIYAQNCRDFDNSPHGGCQKICNTILNCGHSCKLTCHPIGHDLVICPEVCEKPRPIGCSHKCMKTCGQSCGLCPIKMKKIRDFCGHELSIDCGIDVNNVVCTVNCNTMMICGHTCPEICHPTGHDNIRYFCKQTCPRTRYSCSHPCTKFCGDNCGDCAVMIETILPCGHTITHPCYTDIKTLQCNSICGKILSSCGHKCNKRCGEICEPMKCNVLVNKTVLKCRHKPRHSLQIKCCTDISELVCQEKCQVTLLCGHNCSGTCDSCTSTSENLYLNTCHIPCQARCEARLSCNHICSGNHLCGDIDGCPPCQNACTSICAHTKCSLLCGEVCSPCNFPCSYSCVHMKCTGQCSDPHIMSNQIPSNNENFAIYTNNQNEKFCDESCSKQLTCGHRCYGICGEICPAICSICHTNKFNEIINYHRQVSEFLHDGNNNIQIIALGCGHYFEKSYLHTFLQPWIGNGNESDNDKLLYMPHCPKCKSTIFNVFRYKSLVDYYRNKFAPETLRKRQQILYKEINQDIIDGKAGLCLQRLEAILIRQKARRHYDPLTPMLYLLLGLTYASLGKIYESHDYFEKTIISSKSNDFITKSAYVLLAFHDLRGSDSTDSIKAAQLERLYSAENYLQKALNVHKSMTNDMVLEGQFYRNTYQVECLLQSIKQEILLKVKQQKERERKRLEVLETKKLYDASQMSTITPATTSSNNNNNNSVNTTTTGINSIVATTTTATTTIKATTTINAGSSALHIAVSRGQLQDVQNLIKNGASTAKVDSCGNTPLMIAAENGYSDIIQELYMISPWHIVNNTKLTFLDLILNYPSSYVLQSEFISLIEDAARKALQIMSNPSHSWAAAKYYDQCECNPMDNLMNMIGIKNVKKQALELYHSVRADMKRPPQARICSTQAMNFAFTGNPGTGKTTVAKIFGDILSNLGLRKTGVFIETSGQKLLTNGSSKFPDVLKSATPGVLFIDEVYQLNPKSTSTGSDGQAITNAIMEAAENNRKELTIIVAGYGDDVRDKWMSYNPGLPSRFPIEVIFEDFNESELRHIFINMIEEKSWSINNFISNDDGDDDNDKTNIIVDVATVAARRLVRQSNKKGFANARSVRNMVEQALGKASIRQKAEEYTILASGQSIPSQHSTTLLLHDIVCKPIDPYTSPLIKELLDMTGLDAVKSSVQSLIQLSTENYYSELKGEGVVEVSLHRIFLGNPGTGKTTLANLYGRILKELGYLTNGEVIIKGASQLLGQHVGSTPKIVNDLIDSIKGKVLVIDEAYALVDNKSSSAYGTEALNTLVERIQGVEDFVVILCGYESQMKDMIKNSNPGLARRFKIDDAFHFPDYTDDELVIILQNKAKQNSLYLTPELAQDAVKNVLSKQRAKKNFGNVGNVVNLLEKAKERLFKRITPKRLKYQGLWILIASDLYDEQDPNESSRLLESLLNADLIKSHIIELQSRIRAQIQRKGTTNVSSFLKNYAFIGPPGTGKTTVARIFAKIFYQLGLLSTDTVIECKAQELIGMYVGHTAPLVKSKMDDARGGILFIDEAYGLIPNRGSSYANEAIETLISNMTDPIYQGKMLIIFAGYESDINTLLDSNVGLKRRVTERLVFQSWLPSDCWDLLLQLSQKSSMQLSPTYRNLSIDYFKDLSKRPGWGNAGDVNSIYDKMVACFENRIGISLLQNQSTPTTPTTTSTSTSIEANTNNEVNNIFEENDIKTAFIDLLSQRPYPNIISTELNKIENIVPNELLLSDNLQSNQTENEKNMTDENSSTIEVTATNNMNSNIMEDEDWETIETLQNEPSDDEVMSALDLALKELGYTIYETKNIVVKEILPLKLIEHVANQLNRKITMIEPMLKKQCPVLLPKVTLLVEEIEGELNHQRQLRNELKVADEKNKKLLEEKERLRKQEKRMEIVKMIGKCCAGFNWLPDGDGYRCAGGSHTVSKSQLDRYSY